MICAWDNWPQAHLSFCESSLCSWIKEPGNAWSNVGYFAIGIWIWNHSKQENRSGLRILAIAAITTGVGSAFFHASGTLWAGSADLLGMYLGTGALTALNVRRWLGSSWRLTWAIFVVSSLLLQGSAVAFPDSARRIYVLGSPCCFIELRLYFKDWPWTIYRNYFLAWAFMAFATLFWWLDIARILCNPNNHILSGHAAWHLLSAVPFYFLYFFYRQFPMLSELSANDASRRA